MTTKYNTNLPSCSLSCLRNDDKGCIFLLDLHHSQLSKGIESKNIVVDNSFDPILVRDINQLLDIVESNDEKSSALIISSTGKFFSNGHDIGWLMKAVKSNGISSESEAMRFLYSFYELIARIMSFPVPVIAAINGHAFAGGCLLAMAADYRIMRSDRGFICMNEIDMNVAPPKQAPSESDIVPGAFKGMDRKMMSIMKAKLPKSIVQEMFLTGIRLNGGEALKRGVVDAVYPTSKPANANAPSSSSNENNGKKSESVDDTKDFINAAAIMVEGVSKKAPKWNRKTIGILKYEMHQECIDVLRSRL